MTENFVVRTWQTTPIITRSIAVLSSTFSLLVYIKAISPFYLSYSTYYIKKLQLWRLITCFFYFGPFSLDTALHIIFMCRYSKMLEEGFLNSSDYAFLLMFCMSFLFTLSLYLKVTVLGSALSSTITYIWTRKNPNTHVQLLGCVVFPAFYLPFVVPIFSFITERKLPIDDIMGIMVGHMYYYLKYVYPRFGRDVLRTPDWIKRIFGEEIKKENKDRSNGGVNISSNNSHVDHNEVKNNRIEPNNQNVSADAKYGSVVDKESTKDDSNTDDGTKDDGTKDDINTDDSTKEHSNKDDSSVEVLDENSKADNVNKSETSDDSSVEVLEETIKADNVNNNETSDDSIEILNEVKFKDDGSVSDNTFESVASSDEVSFEDWNNEESENN